MKNTVNKMKLSIKCGTAKGTVTAPASKSVAHRLLISAALAKGESRISGITPCEDVLATINCLNALGAKIEFTEDVAIVQGFDPLSAEAREPLWANESGSTLRFLIPIALLSNNKITFGGALRLMQRPLGIYEELCSELGLGFEHNKGKISVCGPLKTNKFKLRGDISSQFITGILFALPFIGGGEIELTTKLESRSYVNLTLDAMREFGISADWASERVICVKEGAYTPKNTTVEGDWSAAAFIKALSTLGGCTDVIGLRAESKQGDKICAEHLDALSRGFATIPLDDCPDLAPILFTVAAACHGGEFVGTARLKIKESDRAAVMAEELRKFGAKIDVFENSVTVHKTELRMPNEILNGHNDHRVVMSLSVLCTKFGGTIDGAEAVSKSYPEFFRDLSLLGIEINEIGNN